LARALVHLASPGTPDVYQGDELWLHALVDPDNRRAVDYGARGAALDALAADGASPDVGGLLASAADGRVKLHLIHRLLRARRDDPGLFARGAYLPLAAEGPRAQHVVAFARALDDRVAIAVAARLPLTLRPDGAPPVGAAIWGAGDTTLPLPAAARPAVGRLVDLLTGRPLAVGGGRLPVAQVLGDGALPVALLVG